MWRLNGDNFAIHVDSEHKEIHRSIKRSKGWHTMATRNKNGKVLAIQYRLPASDYRKARRLVLRVHDSVETSA